MKKIVLAISFLILVGQAKSQVADLFKGFDLSAIQAGDSFAFEIKNTGTEPATFYPLTVFDSPGNYLFLSEEDYFSYLQSAGSQVDALRAHARIVKSPFFFPGQKPVSESENGSFLQEIADKKYTFPQWFLTSCHYQCGEFSAIGASILTRAGILDKDSIWGLNLGDDHSLGEGIINGDTLLIDFDSEMPRFLDTLPNGTYMSASDAYLHPEYFNQQDQYRICNQNDSCWTDEGFSDRYAGFFQDISGFSRYPIHELEPQNMSGAWTLCAGCSFIFEWKMPEYVIDANDTNNWGLIDSMIVLLRNESIDTFVLGDITQRLFSTSSRKEGLAVLNEFNFIPSNELTDLGNSTSFIYNNTTVKIKIPGRPTGYTSADLQLPFAVNKVVSENGLTIGGNFISPGRHEFKLWADGGFLELSEQGNDFSITINPDSFNHLRDIDISANNPVEIELYYNQLLYGFLKGVKAELFAETPNLTVNTYPGDDTGTEARTNSSDKVFPNPTQDELWVADSGMLTNASGAFVLQLEQGINNIAMLAPGIYFFQSKSETQKVVKY